MRKCSLEGCREEAVRQDDEKNLMCGGCFAEWIHNKTKHKLSYVSVLYD